MRRNHLMMLLLYLLTQWSLPKKPSSKLLLLPAELRNEIYCLALSEKSEIRINLLPGAAQARPRRPALLAVCKRIHAEASAMFYVNNMFRITMNMSHFGKLSMWLVSRIKLCGSPAFRSLRIKVVGGVWTGLEHLGPFLQLVRRVGTQLSTERMNLMSVPSTYAGNWWKSKGSYTDSSYSVILTTFGTYDADKVLYQALKMGDRAYKGNWTQTSNSICGWIRHGIPLLIRRPCPTRSTVERGE